MTQVEKFASSVEEGRSDTRWDGGGKVEIQGSWMNTNKNTSFASFQGIPPAFPPTLTNRFLRTKPIQYNSSMTKIDARGIFKTICPQPTDRPNMSEDCLYLND